MSMDVKNKCHFELDQRGLENLLVTLAVTNLKHWSSQADHFDASCWLEGAVSHWGISKKSGPLSTTGLRDALYQILKDRMMEREIIGCAFGACEGRTLDDAFVVLDEAQKATPSMQMMFRPSFEV